MFDAPEFIEESIEQMKATIDDIAIIACSGGVDSTVAAVIANKAVGNLLHCVYVDTGFMRKNETEEIEEMLSQQGINLVTVKAADRYFEALKGVTDPEDKRKVIGELFIRIFEDEQKKCGAKYLVQGTIAPDWIESGGGVRHGGPAAGRAAAVDRRAGQGVLRGDRARCGTRYHAPEDPGGAHRRW